MDKALQYLSLARKAGHVELGEEPVGAAARANRARLIIVAADAGDHTWRRAKSFAAGTNQLCLSVPYGKEALGPAVGRTELAIAGYTDVALGLAFVESLGQPERYGETLAALRAQTQRVRQRQAEAKAHQRNLRQGRLRHKSGQKQD